MQQLVLGLAILFQLQAPPAAPDATTPTTTPTAPATPAPATTPVTTTTEGTTPPATVTPTTETIPATTEKKTLLPPKTKPRMLVMDLLDKGAGPDITNAVNQAVQGQAVLSHTGETVTATQIRLLLDAQANQQLTGCDSELCMTDIGNLIEADVILGGNVAKVGDDVVITVLTVNPADGKRMRQEQRKSPLNRDLYYYAAKQLSSLVLTGKSADPRVIVIINVTADQAPTDGEIFVDGKQVATATTTQQMLEPGQHEVVVKRSGFSDWRTVVAVEEASPLQISVSLVPTRVYLWPVAIGTGVVAVALATTGLLMADYARGEFDGSSAFFNTDAKNSYSGVSPTNSADLCQRELNISFYAGRAPGKDEGTFGSPNECGVATGPGLAIWSLIGAGVAGVATAALVTTDIVLNVAE